MTAIVDPERAERRTAVVRFERDAAVLDAAGVLIAAAQGRWGDAVELGYDDPTGGTQLDALIGVTTTRRVTDAEIAQANTRRTAVAAF